ncbi:hypothetical protein VTG60DRAFT_4229 [Thermothelomyces hinnuleus]
MVARVFVRRGVRGCVRVYCEEWPQFLRRTEHQRRATGPRAPNRLTCGGECVSVHDAVRRGVTNGYMVTRQPAGVTPIQASSLPALTNTLSDVSKQRAEKQGFPQVYAHEWCAYAQLWVLWQDPRPLQEPFPGKTGRIRLASDPAIRCFSCPDPAVHKTHSICSNVTCRTGMPVSSPGRLLGGSDHIARGITSRRSVLVPADME